MKLLDIKTSVGQKVKKIAEDTRQKTLIQVENSSITFIFLKWIFTNKVSVALAILLGIFMFRYSYLEYQYLAEKNKILIEEKEKYLNRTKELKAKIEAFNALMEAAKGKNIKIREESKKLTSLQRKELILDLVRKILLLRYKNG